jgi:putative FmdB family regulatory protein
MSPIYDVICDKCKEVKEEWLKMDEEPEDCHHCSHPRKKMPGGHFKLVYNPQRDICSWGFEGYASSQYWNGVKEAKERTGKTHKGINEDG